MAEDISVAVRIAVVLCMVGAMLSSVLNVAVPATKYLTQFSDKYTQLSSMTYHQFQSKSGHELNSARVYRYIVETYNNVATVAIREKPVSEPNTIDLIVCKEKNFVMPELEPYVLSVTDYSDDEHGYSILSKKLEHDYINDRFRLTINTLSDGGLEVVCDLVDEYYE